MSGSHSIGKSEIQATVSGCFNTVESRRRCRKRPGQNGERSYRSKGDLALAATDGETGVVSHRFRRSRSFRPADYAGGVSGDQVVGRNVLAHHGPGADDGAVANGHPLRMMARVADEDTATDDDWLGIVRRGIAPVPFADGGVKIVVEDQAPRSHKRSLPDVNPLSGAHGVPLRPTPRPENNFRAGPQGVQRHRLGAGEGVAAEGTV